MIIAHLPAGYILARAVVPQGARWLFASLLIGSVAPDLDMLWFFFVDGQQTHHHDFVTHRPAVWAVLLFVALMVRWAVLVGIGAGALLHLALDSIAGKIAWLWPVSDIAVPLVVVPATQSHWVLSFLLHWTFAVEIAICLIGLMLFVQARRARS